MQVLEGATKQRIFLIISASNKMSIIIFANTHEHLPSYLALSPCRFFSVPNTRFTESSISFRSQILNFSISKQRIHFYLISVRNPIKQLHLFIAFRSSRTPFRCHRCTHSAHKPQIENSGSNATAQTVRTCSERASRADRT